VEDGGGGARGPGCLLTIGPGRWGSASSDSAQTTEYVDNSFHALKVAFANEIGALCRPPALSRLMGANRTYRTDHLPRIGQLLTEDLDEVPAHAGVCVVGTQAPEVAAALRQARDDQLVVDLLRLPGARELPHYAGIGW
jgi:hypothetical protein